MDILEGYQIKKKEALESIKELESMKHSTNI